MNERVEVDERAETPTRSAGPSRQWPLLAGATGAALLGAAVWVALHRGAPRLPLLVPALVVAVALLVGPAAYRVRSRSSGSWSDRGCSSWCVR